MQLPGRLCNHAAGECAMRAPLRERNPPFTGDKEAGDARACHQGRAFARTRWVHPASVLCSGHCGSPGVGHREPSKETEMLTVVGIFMVVVVALLSNKEQRKAAWLLAAAVIVLVLIADRMR